MRAFVLFFIVLCLTGCAPTQADFSAPPALQPTPVLPSKLSRSASGQPELQVYIKAEDRLRALPIENYVACVLAGEMANDWPLEALKAQAVLARTFVMKFVSEKESRYEGADISSDITEAQAYDEAGVNDRILRAVQETQGQVLAVGDQFPYAWFHAHSGGVTAFAQEGLDYQKEEPVYTQVTPGRESAAAPEEAQVWEASFTANAFLSACKDVGVPLDELYSLSIHETGPSGRAVTLLVNDTPVAAAPLRLALGSTVMRSTLLTDLHLANGRVVMAGKGYGHGVGMSQWGAYALAEAGHTYDDIILSYFDNVRLVTLW